MKRVISLLLAVCILSSVCAFSIETNALTESGTCGDNLTWEYDSDTCTLTISGTGDMADFWSAAPWTAYSDTMKTVIIEDGVMSIGDYAFYYCSSLTSVTIPNSVTNISDYAFWECTSLTSVSIPDSVTSIGGGAFAWCSNLTSVIIGDSVSSIGDYAFYYCSSLTSVTIPNSVTSIGNQAFSGCNNLTEIVVSNNNSTYTSQDGVLFSKDATSLILYPAGNSRTEYTIPDSVTSIGDGAFSYCSSLTTVVIGNGVTSIGYSAFAGCTSLTTVTIPDSVTRIGDSAFSDCPNLTDVYYTGTEEEWNNILIDEYGNDCLLNATIHFNYVSDIPSVIPDNISGTCGDNLTWKYDTNTCTLTISGAGKMTAYGVESKDGKYVTAAPWRLFVDTIKTVVIVEGVTSIGGNAFRGCTNLDSVSICNSVTNIESCAFASCNIDSLYIPDSVIDFGFYAFVNSSIESVYIANISKWCDNHFASNGSNPIEISKNVCLDGQLVGDLVLPDTVKKIGQYAFSCCEELTSVFISDSVEEIDSFAFGYCSNLASVTIEKSVREISECAFHGCSNLTDVYYIGTEEEWNNISIEDYNDCLLNATIHFNYVPEGPTVVPGDISGDGKVNVTDGLMIKRLITGSLNSADYMDAADLNSDGKINAVDSVMLKKIILGSK